MERLAHRHGRSNPSFSSSLLDSIYRSIDEPDTSSPRPALSSTSKRPTTSLEKKCTPTPPPPANLRHHFSTSNTGYSSAPPQEPKTPSSVRHKFCNLRAPASPGTRLAAFLNSMFATGGKAKKAKFAEPARTCVEKMPELSRGGRGKGRFGEVPTGARDRRMLVEELMRGLSVEEEEGDCGSVCSEELFELENFPAIGRFRDELPLYETTVAHVKLNTVASRLSTHPFRYASRISTH